MYYKLLREEWTVSWFSGSRSYAPYERIGGLVDYIITLFFIIVFIFLPGITQTFLVLLTIYGPLS